jgi:hypothetical protein
MLLVLVIKDHNGRPNASLRNPAIIVGTLVFDPNVIVVRVAAMTWNLLANDPHSHNKQ